MTDPLRFSLVGATGSGKTDVAIALAQLAPLEILSADSMQVYRRMNIGTAKPDLTQQSQATFHGIDLVDPNEEWTLSTYQSYGEQAIAQIQQRGRAAWIVGGTGLYIRSLTMPLGLPHVPPNHPFRAAKLELVEKEGILALQRELAEVDPGSAARLHANDARRMIRALEVHSETGKTLTEWHREDHERPARTDCVFFGLQYSDRTRLYERINRRTQAMFDGGLVEETRQLRSDGFGPHLNPMQSLGYRQANSYLDHRLTLPDAIEETQRASRNYARRQLIWFRADSRIQWVEAQDKYPEELAQEIWVLWNKRIEGLPLKEICS